MIQRMYSQDKETPRRIKEKWQNQSPILMIDLPLTISSTQFPTSSDYGSEICSKYGNKVHLNHVDP
jgi:hypothetical protein